MHKVRLFLVLAGTLAGYGVVVVSHATSTVIGQFGGIGQYINQ